MSKYEKLWEYIAENGTKKFRMTFSEIESILGFSIDHSFLTFKKELISYGFEVGKISMKEHMVEIRKADG